MKLTKKRIAYIALLGTGFIATVSYYLSHSQRQIDACTAYRQEVFQRIAEQKINNPSSTVYTIVDSKKFNCKTK